MHRTFLFILLLTTVTFQAQEQYCRTTEAHEAWFARNPHLKAGFDSLQRVSAAHDKINFSKGYLRENNAQGRSAAFSTFTIPVVFHILHTGGAENISDAQVQDAVAILTRDFNRQNADTVNVVKEFKDKIGDPSVTFVLASRDPSGNCTNGILRHWDMKTDWHGNPSEYIYSWPRHRYLNIYVVRSIESGAAGYTYLPGSGIPASMDAIVVLNSYVGSFGTSALYKSRVLTHEVGHWLDLKHTWGWTNNPGVSCGDDGISDTPITKGFTACNLTKADICNAGLAENVQNYMEYAYCYNMFTTGQAFHMQNILNSTVNGRNNLSDPANLLLTGVDNPLSNCTPLLDIMATPGYTACAGKPVTFTSFTSNAHPDTYSWTAGSSASVTAPASASTTIVFNSTGSHTITCTASNLYGSAIRNLVVYIKDGATELPNGGSESFESGTLPAFWSVPGKAQTAVNWEPNSDASSHGAWSMMIAGDQLPPNAERILEGPSYDFKNNPGSLLSFKYAYARASAENKDVFRVQGSTDCGSTWKDIYYPGNGQMASGSGGVNAGLFVPPVEAWKYYNLSAHPNFHQFRNETNVRIRFYFQEDPGGSGYGNRLYIDEINYALPTGINEISRSIGLNIYPNPASTGVTVSFQLSDAAEITCELVSVTGAVVLRENRGSLVPGEHNITFNTTHLKQGIYFLNFQMNGTRLSRKVMVE